jgi:hypothetical protein
MRSTFLLVVLVLVACSLSCQGKFVNRNLGRRKSSPGASQNPQIHELRGAHHPNTAAGGGRTPDWHFVFVLFAHSMLTSWNSIAREDTRFVGFKLCQKRLNALDQYTFYVQSSVCIAWNQKPIDRSTSSSTNPILNAISAINWSGISPQSQAGDASKTASFLEYINDGQVKSRRCSKKGDSWILNADGMSPLTLRQGFLAAVSILTFCLP